MQIVNPNCGRVKLDQKMIAMTDLDPRVNDEVRVELKDSVEEWQLGSEGQNTSLGGGLITEEVDKMKKILGDNHDMFAWTVEDMSGIDLRIMSRNLVVCKEAKPISQKKQRLGEENRLAAKAEVRKLLDVDFIRKVQYITWLANVVAVKKSNGQ